MIGQIMTFQHLINVNESLFYSFSLYIPPPWSQLALAPPMLGVREQSHPQNPSDFHLSRITTEGDGLSLDQDWLGNI